MNFTCYFKFDRPGHNLAALDGFRAVAILLVMPCHWVLAFVNGEPGMSLSVQRALTPLMNGLVGVDLFFVLSGFLITHHIYNRYLEDQGASKFLWKHYLLRRALRILPAFYASLILAGAVAYCIGQDAENLGSRLFVNVVFLQDYIPTNLPVGSWSLGVEEKFYLLAPLLMLVLAKLPSCRWQVAVLIALFCVSPIARYLNVLEHPALYTVTEVKFLFRYPFHLNFESLTLGIICAVLYRNSGFMAYARKHDLGEVFFLLGAILLFYVLVLIPYRIDTIDGLSPYRGPSIMTALLPTITAASFGAMVLGALVGAKAGRFLESPHLYPVAVLSYSLYLVHLMTLYGAIRLTGLAVSVMSGQDLRDFTPVSQMLITLPAFVALTSLGAVAMYHVVEKPFLRLRKRQPALAAAATRTV